MRALVHHHDAVGDLERLLLVVRHEDARHVDLVVQPAQPLPQLLPHLRVERAERLVEQQHLRLRGQRAGQRDALPLAAGELRRIARAEALEPDQLQQLVARARAISAFGDAAHAQAEADVVERSVMWRNSA